MFFTKARFVTGLVLVIGVFAAGAGALSFHLRADDPPGDNTVPVDAPKAKIGESLKIPKELLQERLRAAQAAYKQNFERVRVHLAAPLDAKLPEWSERWLKAELAVVIGDNKKDRLVAYQDHLERVKAVERLAIALSKTGQGRQSDADGATYFRVEAEIWLLQAGGKLTQPAAGPAKEGKGQVFWIDPVSGNQYFVGVSNPVHADDKR
jgi:hypothetical protein